MRGVDEAGEYGGSVGASIPLEIAFLARYGVPRETLAAAAATAIRCGVSPEQALLGEGAIAEDRFYRRLADRLGVPYYKGGSLADDEIAPRDAILAGFARLDASRSRERAAVAPHGAALRYLLETVEAGRPAPPIAICSRQRLGALVRSRHGERIAEAAAETLEIADPSLSARTGLSLGQVAFTAAAAALLAASAVAFPGLPSALIAGVLWLIFAAWIVLRSSAVVAAESSSPAPALSDAELPLYTIIAALRQEGRVVANLARALDALDYPKAKLDIKLVVERGDAETLEAIAALRLPARYDIVIAPPGAPLTKPRALNIALDAARGELLVVFDAEDEPAPDQLRLAAERFARDPNVDALQARLAILNADDSWFSQLFAVEYAALFDLVNPGLAALELPIALGGTSNHFRVGVLRRVGGWDAWNVTEDADLGIRLARFGARVGSLASDTWEEAPNDFRNWFRQRVRWQKGWIQTLIVHSRHPIRLAREMGFLRAFSAAVLIAGTVSGGLFGPPLLIETLWRGLREYAGLEHATRSGDVVTYILMLAGAQSIAIPAVVAMRRRGMSDIGGALLKMPAYYALVWIASWVALFDLALRPHYWGKTDHGRRRSGPPPRLGQTEAV